MRQRKGFTLIELVVALAVLSILIYMAFASFSIASAVSTSNQNREAVLEDMSTVLDQLTKELRQTVTVKDGTTQDGARATSGVTLPAWASADTSRGIPAGPWNCNTSVLTSSSPKPGELTTGQFYAFNPAVGDVSSGGNGIVLEFFTLDTSVTPSIKHRIRYSLMAPMSGSTYVGVAQQYWASQSYEPCQIIYSNETYNGTTWTGVTRQPVTGQVITNFTVIRPTWSTKVAVLQIVLQAMVRNGSGSGSTTITRIAQISLRQ